MKERRTDISLRVVFSHEMQEAVESMVLYYRLLHGYDGLTIQNVVAIAVREHAFACEQKMKKGAC